MMHGPRAHPDTAAMVERTLTDKFVKMLNLAHAWLDQLLPHVLSKINRVNYGLLSKEQQAADMPTSRKLLAVPFLGKDVPSPASEYAAPRPRRRHPQLAAPWNRGCRPTHRAATACLQVPCPSPSPPP